MSDVPLDDSLPSTQQNEWVVIADKIRGSADKLANRDDLKPDELCWLVRLATEARMFNLLALSFDIHLEQMQRPHYCGGGD